MWSTADRSGRSPWWDRAGTPWPITRRRAGGRRWRSRPGDDEPSTGAAGRASARERRGRRRGGGRPRDRRHARRRHRRHRRRGAPACVRPVRWSCTCRARARSRSSTSCRGAPRRRGRLAPPAQSLPSPELGANGSPARGARSDGPPRSRRLALTLGMRPFRVDDRRRRLPRGRDRSRPTTSSRCSARRRASPSGGVPPEALLPLVRRRSTTSRPGAGRPHRSGRARRRRHGRPPPRRARPPTSARPTRCAGEALRLSGRDECPARLDEPARRRRRRSIRPSCAEVRCDDGAPAAGERRLRPHHGLLPRRAPLADARTRAPTTTSSW